jgi:phosphate transport system substrate-binding protein
VDLKEETPLYRFRPLAGKVFAGLALGAMIAVAGCGGSTSTGGNGTPTAQCPQTTSLSGTGSTFDNPLFSKMFEQYAMVGCQVQVTYTSTGSGAGKSQLLAGTVDFGATDAPMTDTELASSTKGPILHIPVTIAPVAVSYNNPDVASTTHLQLTGDTLANIFLGTVKFWDDPSIVASNSGATLTHQAINVVHRSDGSGTTGIFTQYLAAVSPAWASGPKAGTTINWPVGQGAKGNDGVAKQVQNTKYSIGYNEFAYVLQNNISYASVQNHDASGFIAPSLDSAKAAANSATNIPADLRFYIVNEPGAQSYPISGYSWVIVYQNQSNSDKGQAIANMLWWMTHDGQSLSSAISYVPLAPSIVTADEAKIRSMTCGSGSCYKG